MVNTSVLIGRFQPLHAGHRELIRQARSKCDKLLILVGSANSARTIKNPFTYLERETQIDEFLFHENISNVEIIPLNDYKYSDTQWLTDVSNIILEYAGNGPVSIVGYNKPGNDYLKWFPQYGFIDVKSPYSVCSTEIREKWFKSGHHDHFAETVYEDWNYFKKEKELFSDYPFPETLNFNCADTILECAGHVLLIQRARAPGRGTWALPGGFKNANETFIDCAIRELQEETNVRVPEKVLRGSIVSTKLFDSPNRGNGIPRNTFCVHIRIDVNADGSIPRANGADDAMDCGWYSINEVMNSMSLYDDHSDIIQTVCGVLPLPAHLNPKFGKV